MTRIVIGRGVLSSFASRMSGIFGRGRAVFVADARLGRLARELGARLARSGWKVSCLTLDAGERAKSFRPLERVYDHLLRAGADRRSVLVALGGGTIGDVAGFAAATYHRGMPLVQVPTTLLAQVDSAIGGKTAINHPRAKNAIGAFHQPKLVIADVDCLRGLAPRQFHAGLAEVVKYALLFDPRFARWLEVHWEKLLGRDPDSLARMVRRCALWKTRVVAKDERDENGKRAMLNFGHTVGHALESASGYRLLHGEAVAWGMRAAVALSRARGWLGRDAIVDRLLDRLPAPPWPPKLRPRDVLAPMRLDKKGSNVFILLRTIGHPVRVADLRQSQILAALERIR